jgi:hypothetical protein
MPFRYGKAVVTTQPYAHLRATVEVDGRAVTGVAASALPPLWFDKDPSKSHDEQIRDLLRSIRAARDAYGALPASNAFDLHQAGEPEARRRCRLNDLTAGFGVAMLDAAVVDALCRVTGSTFHAALRADLLGFGPVPLPERPIERLHVRHTVGLADPITAADVREKLADGLPQTLEEVVRSYRVRYFKLKVSGNAAESLDRLRRIASVLDRDAGDYQLSLDGNEQFARLRDFAEFAGSVSRELPGLWRRTLWIEQPVERGAALRESVPAELGKPVIIDESDGTDGVVDVALGLGYGGISVKLCKGVYRALHSLRRTSETKAILSSEDLMNIAVVPLQQDSCLAAALGIPHSERNGHHFFRAFDFLSPAEREAALREFPSLYRADPPSVRVADGALDLSEVNRHGFGTLSEPDWYHLEEMDLPEIA